MGIYLNPTNEKFGEALHSEIYVDKTGMIQCMNRVMRTEDKYVCVSRPRRFGKSIAASMLAAYYSRGCSSKELFSSCKIAKQSSFEQGLNQYDVIFLNMQEFLSRSQSMDDMLKLLSKSLLWELLEQYPDYRYFDATDLVRTLQDIYYNTRIPFVIIIDEWDCIFREYKENDVFQREYLDFLRNLLKDKEYVQLAYMTGILPIKKYGTHSALNMFGEYSMMDAGMLAEYVGFTEDEVRQLCMTYQMDFEETKMWYDGYHLMETGALYSPRSVVSSMKNRKFNNYWNQTETFEALKIYIDMNFDGLRDAVLAMVAGDKKQIDTRSFANDMTTFHSGDDVLTLLIHLGYLAFDFEKSEVYIPNKEIMDEFITATKISKWTEIIGAVQSSEETLRAIWNFDEIRVAECIEKAHFETSILQYNNENALSYTISLALFAARQYYTVIRELPTGKGFADVVFIPRKKYAEKPAIIFELKWNKSVSGALGQIEEQRYLTSLAEYHGNLILVGVNYDKKTKKHTCKITKGSI